MLSPPPQLLPLVQRPKTLGRQVWDLVGLPIRFLLPDHIVEAFGLTSLRAERFGAALAEMRGRCLDIGCGPNTLLSLYARQCGDDDHVGLEIFDWGGGATVVPSVETLPFESAVFDSVVILAALNHIPERKAVLTEALRVLRPEGKLIVSMITPFVGGISHRIRFWGEHSHRGMEEGETFGLAIRDVEAMIVDGGFNPPRVHGFLYGFNTLFVATKP